MQLNFKNKNYRSTLQSVLRGGWLIYLFCLSWSTGLAQIPEGVPHPDQNTPIDFSSWSDLVIYIILPGVLIIGYIVMVYRRRRKQRRDGGENDQDVN